MPSPRHQAPSRLLLGTWPTALEPAPRLAAMLGLAPDDLFVKRDDLTGLGAGGNKVRKLEYLCAAARANGASCLVTSGAAQSNHARLTAAAAARLGLRCHLVLAGDAPSEEGGNVALDHLFGAGIEWAGPSDDLELVRLVGQTAERLTADGETVEVIPYGGSSVLGACGYAICGDELAAQLPAARHVVVAVGSGGTMAGLVAAMGAERVLGVDVGALPDPASRVGELVVGLGELLGTLADPVSLRLRRDQIGSGYGVLTEAAGAAMLAAARCEGLVLDPVYTAKALAGLTAAVAEGDIRPGEPVVFVHTGGLPGLFGHESALALASPP
jgi:D-cysteine desulfhydrase